MIKLKVTYKVDPNSPLNPKRLKAICLEAHEALDSQIIGDTDPFVPYKSGALAASPMQNHKKPGLIQYKTPYARRQYYGDTHHFNKSKHPQARARWFDYAMSIWLEKWVKVVRNIIAERVKDGL